MLRPIELLFAMRFEPQTVPSLLLTAAIGVVTSAVTAFATVRFQMYQERERWKKDFALKLAEIQTTNPLQGAKVSQQFAVGVLMLDEADADVQRKRFFIPFYGSLSVGTDYENEIVLKDELCSSKHVLFFANDSDVFALDLKSQNGTWLNGKRLRRSQKLVDGDVMTFTERRSTTKITFVAIKRM